MKQPIPGRACLYRAYTGDRSPLFLNFGSDTGSRDSRPCDFAQKTGFSLTFSNVQLTNRQVSQNFDHLFFAQLKGEFNPHFRGFFGTNWDKSARDYESSRARETSKAYRDSQTQNLDKQIAKLSDLHGRFSVKKEKIKRCCFGCAYEFRAVLGLFLRCSKARLPNARTKSVLQSTSLEA